MTASKTKAVSVQRADKAIWSINGRFVTQPMTGVQRYAHEIVRALDDLISQDPAIGRRLGLQLVVPPQPAALPPLSAIEVQHTRRGSGHLWDQFVLPRFETAGILSLGNFGPIMARHGIVCIHDANTFIQPESYSRTFGAAYRTLLPWIGRRARRIATVSQFSADMLVRHSICPREKIFIAPDGFEHALRWDADRADLAAIPTTTRPFVLLLGSRARHKNIRIILRQAEALDRHGIDIVVTGASSSIFASDEAPVLRGNVHYTGRLSDDELAVLYRRAACLAFPSTTEGFGLPLLEAMARGCPVVSSTAASLTEVGGGAALYVDPDDAAGWTAALVRVAGDENLREQMAAEGRKQARLFSWSNSARIYLDEMLALSDRADR